MSAPRRFLVRLWRITAFVGFFIYEFIVSNLVVLREVYRIRSRIAPAMLEIPLRCRTRMEIVSLGNLIGLTPGTLTIEASQDPPTLYVHGMFAGDPASFRRQISRLEDYLLGALRPVADGAPPPRGTVPPPQEAQLSPHGETPPPRGEPPAPGQSGGDR